MAKVKTFNRNDRVRNPKTGVSFVVEGMAGVVVHGRVRQVVYGSCGEREFADDLELASASDNSPSPAVSEYEAKMRAHEREFAACIWEHEINRSAPLLRGEAIDRLVEHLSAFRGTVEEEQSEDATRMIEGLRGEILDLNDIINDISTALAGGEPWLMRLKQGDVPPIAVRVADTIKQEKGKE